MKRLAVLLILGNACFGQTAPVRLELPPGVPAETVTVRSTVVDSAAALRVIVYAPGCALQTVAVALNNVAQRSVPFTCHVLPSLPFKGVAAGKLPWDRVEIRVNYVPGWAEAFFGSADIVMTTIPVAQAYADADGRFNVSLPDFAREPDRPGGFEFWAHDKGTGALLAKLIPSAQALKFGALAIAAGYDGERSFTVCKVNASLEHQDGFAIRTEASACNP